MRGVLPNPEGKILAGLYARVRVPVEKKPLFLVSEVAVGSDQQGSYLLLINEKNTVERRSVKTGPLVDNLRAIEEGLNGREWVIIKGLLRALPGRQVSPEQESSPSSSASHQSPQQGKVKP
jgi:hypothetical protein